MAKMKFPEAGLIATLNRSILNSTDFSGMGEPCYTVSDEGCNTSTVKAWYTLETAGFVTHGYNGRRCPHGRPTSGGRLGYIYDNYVERAMRFPCELAVKKMLTGSVALMMFKNIEKSGRSELDLWVTDRCVMMNLFENRGAEEVWIWGLGNFNYHTLGKPTQHRRRHAASPVFF